MSDPDPDPVLELMREHVQLTARVAELEEVVMSFIEDRSWHETNNLARAAMAERLKGGER